MDLEGVGQGAADDAGGLDVTLLGDFLSTVVDAATTGRTLRGAELRRYGECGARAANAGVPLRALIDLYLSASWRLWSELPIVNTGSADQVRAAGLAMLHAADDGVAALAEGFQLARTDLVRRQDAERTEVLEALLAGGPAAQSVLGRAADLGLELSGPHAVLVAADLMLHGSAAAAVIGRAERALTGRLGDAQPLLSVRQGQLVCVFAAPDAAATEQVSARLAAVLDAESSGSWQIAVGRSLPGPGGVRVSYDQAHDTLELAARLGLAKSVLTSADLVVYRVLLRDRAAIAELIETMLGPLAGMRGGAGPVLETLDAYYASGAVTAQTARRLHLSVRAVTYRLARARQVLGRDPADPAERFAMHAAVLGARLLDWPKVALTD